MANVKTVNLDKPKLKTYLLENNYDLYETSRQMGMSDGYLHDLFNKDDRGMSKIAYIVLCSVLDVSMDMFLLNNNVKKSTKYDNSEVDMLYLLSEINGKLSTIIALLNLEER